MPFVAWRVESHGLIWEYRQDPQGLKIRHQGGLLHLPTTSGQPQETLALIGK